MNIVERIAQIFEPGAYGDWYDGTGTDAMPIEPSTRTKYLRAQAEHRATEALRVVLSMSPDAIREQMVEFDIECWGKLGLVHPDLPAMVRAKHGAEHVSTPAPSESGNAREGID